MAGLSKNQRKILEILEIKPEMTTKEIAETAFCKARAKGRNPALHLLFMAKVL